jgi:hypothetical protein
MENMNKVRSNLFLVCHFEKILVPPYVEASLSAIGIWEKNIMAVISIHTFKIRICLDNTSGFDGCCDVLTKTAICPEYKQNKADICGVI